MLRLCVQVLVDVYTLVASIAMASLLLVTVVMWALGWCPLRHESPYSPHRSRPVEVGPGDRIPAQRVPVIPPAGE